MGLAFVMKARPFAYQPFVSYLYIQQTKRKNIAKKVSKCLWKIKNMLLLPLKTS